MSSSNSTCWTLIQGAAVGGEAEREAFAQRYLPVVRAYLAARWRNSHIGQHLDDAAQDVFAECFRSGGPLARADRNRSGGFRPFLYGVTRTVARRFERKNAVDRSRSPISDVDFAAVEADETSLSQLFDREWARTILREAAARQAERARAAGPDAQRRHELLELRFQKGAPIREIAEQWNIDAAKVHREYAKAREEYRQALQDVVAFHQPDATAVEVRQECADLLRAIG